MGTASASEHPGEAVFEQISKAVPAFGGFFLEGDNVVVYVTDQTKSEAAQDAVRQHLATGMPLATDPRLAHPQFVTRVARYSFGQLRDWRDQIKHQVLLALPDAAWIDLDEVRNQVAIGLADGSGRRDVLESVHRLGVPPEAIRIEVTGKDAPNDLLTSRVRPVVGGLSNAVTFGGVSQVVPWCTFGFNARYNGLDVILTASHCTSLMYGNDLTSTVFYQNNIADTNRIGSESYDPATGASCVTPNGYIQHCHRFSDAAMILYDAGVNLNLGYLARTTSRSTTWGTDGSKTIDAASPRFRIVASQSYPVANARVDKVGWKTGWTSGLVTATCVDIAGSDDYWRDCTYQANYWASGGDSGSPVFIWGNDTTVTLVGIHWGSSAQGQHSDFSPMGGIFQDFGSVVAERPLLSVSIDGPTTVYANETHTWSAIVSGGVPPYTYQWYLNGAPAGNGQSITLSAGESFDLSVHVTDGISSSQDASMSVYVISCPPPQITCE